MTRVPNLRDDRPLDPADRRGVFTVHVRDAPQPALRGRVTHAATGTVAHFDSVAELEVFVRRVLAGEV